MFDTFPSVWFINLSSAQYTRGLMLQDWLPAKWPWLTERENKGEKESEKQKVGRRALSLSMVDAGLEWSSVGLRF